MIKYNSNKCLIYDSKLSFFQSAHLYSMQLHSVTSKILHSLWKYKIPSTNKNLFVCVCVWSKSNVAGISFIKIIQAIFSTRLQMLWLQWLVGKKKKSLSLSHVKFQFPSVVSADYETGEVKSLVLRCRSCIKNTRSSFPGVREPCEVGWLSHFQVKMIKALGTLRAISTQPKHSIKAFRNVFSWQTIMRRDVWPCQVVIWGKSWKGRASIFNVYPKRRNDFHFTHTKKMSKCCSEMKLVVI